MEAGMLRRALFPLIVVVCLAATAACSRRPATAAPDPTPALGMPNPASVHCEENGGRVEAREGAGGSAGVCVFADGSECDEWAFFRGECGPAGTPGAMPPLDGQGPSPEAALAPDGCLLYQDAALGYSFHYPADATIEWADEPLRSLTITGPLVAENNWPLIGVSHPADRPEYRPPEGADLAAWLSENRLLAADAQEPAAEARQADTVIAGTLAIHTRFERSPQSFAYDKYFFARAGQLYQIVILHTGDKEDWEVYDHFLQSFTFEQ
jgi:putative hemolysin